MARIALLSHWAENAASLIRTWQKERVAASRLPFPELSHQRFNVGSLVFLKCLMVAAACGVPQIAATTRKMSMNIGELALKTSVAIVPAMAIPINSIEKKAD